MRKVAGCETPGHPPQPLDQVAWRTQKSTVWRRKKSTATSFKTGASCSNRDQMEKFNPLPTNRWPLIQTRLRPPHSSAGLVHRPRLEKILKQIKYHSLTLVKAPAGYGKSSLLSQWCVFRLIRHFIPISSGTLFRSIRHPVSVPRLSLPA